MSSYLRRFAGVGILVTLFSPLVLATDLSVLIGQLKDQDMSVRTQSAQQIAEIGKEASAAVPALIEALKDPASPVSVRASVVYAFSRIGPAARDAVPSLIWALTAVHPPDCNTFECLGQDMVGPVIAALGEIGPAASPAVPALLKVLEANDQGHHRSAVFRTLGLIGPGAAAAVPALIDSLKNSPPGLGGFTDTIDALGKIGPAARAASPLLRDLFRETSRGYSAKNIATAIRSIDGDTEATLLLLLEPLADEKSDRVEVSREILQSNVELPATAIPLLVKGLHSDQSGMKQLALRRLAEFGPAAAACKPEVLEWIRSSHSNFDGSLEVLLDAAEKLELHDRETVEALCTQLDSSDGRMGEKTAKFLLKIGTPEAKHALECCSPSYRRGYALLRGDITNVEEPAIISAVRKNDVTALTSLISAGTPDAINERGNFRKTALSLAVEQGKSEIAMLLFQGGADPSLMDCSERSAVDIAVQLGNLSLISAFGEKHAPNERQRAQARLIDAVRKGDVAFIASLPAGSPHINARDINGVTPLLLAIEKDQPQAAMALLEKGADVELSDEKGKLPLAAAASKNSLELIHSLLKHGALINGGNEKNWKPIEVAVYNGSLPIVKALIEGGADIHLHRYDGESLVGIALDQKHDEVATFLVERGVRAEQRDFGRRMYEAVNANDGAEVTRLVQMGANPNFSGDSGWTPVHYAVASAATTALDALLAAGGDINIKNGSGDTSLELLEKMVALSPAQKQEMRDYLKAHGAKSGT